MSTMSTRGLRLLAVLLMLATAGLVFASPAEAKGKNKDIQYSFTFVNGQTISGTATSNEVFLPNAGGTSADNPTGMTVHVSCSDDFPNGWGEKDGPELGVDTAWQIASFSISKDGGKKTCGDDFTPPGPPPEPAVQIVKTVNGQDANEAPGPMVEVGSTVVLGYTVTNTGDTVLNEIVVTDLDLGVINCPQTTLAIGASMVCDEATMFVAQAGQVFMEARVDAVGATRQDITPPQGEKYGYVFNFENGVTITGTSDDNEPFVPNAGGTSVDNPIGMFIHVSCSDDFPNGWGEKAGPEQGRDSAWRIASYRIEKEDGKVCGDGVADVSTPVSDIDPINYIAKDTPPPPPELECAVRIVGGTDAKVTWTHVDARKYAVKRNNTWLGTFLRDTTMFTDQDIPVGVHLAYYVRAIFDDGSKSPWIECGKVRIDDHTPPPPVLECTVQVVNGDQVKVSWTDVGAKKYAVKHDAAWLDQTTGTHYVDANPPTGRYVTYSVRAIFADGTKGDWISCGKIKIDEHTPPPPGLECSVQVVNGDEVKVSWTDVGAKKYAVKHDAAWLDQVKGATHYVDTNPPTGRFVTYYVRAIFEDGTKGDWVSCGQIKIDEQTPPPGDCTAVVTSGGDVRIEWAAVDGASEYFVYRNGVVVHSRQMPGWTDTTAPAGQDLTYEVSARTPDGKTDRVQCGTVQI